MTGPPHLPSKGKQCERRQRVDMTHSFSPNRDIGVASECGSTDSLTGMLVQTGRPGRYPSVADIRRRSLTAPSAAIQKHSPGSSGGFVAP